MLEELGDKGEKFAQLTQSFMQIHNTHSVKTGQKGIVVVWVLQCHSGYWWGGKTWNPDTPPGLWVCMQFGKYVSAWWGAGAFNMAGCASWDDAHYAGVVAWRGGGSGARETTVMARTTTSSQSESWVERGGGGGFGLGMGEVRGGEGVGCVGGQSVFL